MKNFKNKRFKIIKDVAISNTGDSSVLLHLKSGIYFELNEVAMSIVDNLKDFTDIKKINKVVLDNFDITEAECEKDVNLFLYNLIERNLLEIAEED